MRRRSLSAEGRHDPVQSDVRDDAVLASGSISDEQYGVFAHDWRGEPADQWLRLKAERASRIDGAVGA